MEEKIYLRRVKETDMKLLFDWRNNELVRKNSFCMDPVEWNEHVKWFNTTLVKSSVKRINFNSRVFCADNCNCTANIASKTIRFLIV